MEFNEVCFIPDEVNKNMHIDLIKYLLKANDKFDKRFNDIHITTDGFCTIIQWVDRDFEDDCSGKFGFIDWNQRVMLECELPDNSIVMCYDEDEAKETLDNWLKENPGYEQNEYGRWVNTNECRAIKDMVNDLKKNDNKNKELLLEDI